MSKLTKSKILGVSFNQDQECFACGTETGIEVYQSLPYKGTVKRILNGGISQVAMLYRSNILALIGGGENPKYPLKKVMLWDDKTEKCVGELSFKFPVRSVKLHKEKIVVALDNRVHIYRFSDLELLDAIDTCENPQGLCDITTTDYLIIVCPDTRKGAIRVINYENNRSIAHLVHESPISAIAITRDGKLTAAGLEDGRVIKVVDTMDGRIYQELHRGSNKAEIQCLIFDSIGSWLLCSSDKETVHIFSVHTSATEEEKTELAKNPRSTLKFMKGFSSYFSAERSFAQFRIPYRKAAVAFGPAGKNQVIVITYEGKYYRIEFDPKTGGECKKLEEKSLFDNK